MLALQELTIGYRTRQSVTSVAQVIDLRLQAGELVCLLGPNGAGKSTLMRTVVGMQPPLAGRILIDGSDLLHMSARERARSFGVVLTDRVAAGLLSTYALVALGRYPFTKWHGRLDPEDRAIVAAALEMTGATPLAHRFVSDLSDGERQRVMLARALAQQPRLMVLDEITAFLDLPRRVEIMTLLKRLAHTTGCAVLISTHDLDLALRTADHVWLLSSDGRFRSGAPEDLVLAGDLAATFGDEHVDFDPLRGVLQARQTLGSRVLLSGELSLRREWTQRALERCGFTVVPGEVHPQQALPHVQVVGEEGWWLHRTTEDREHFATIGALARAIRPVVTCSDWNTQPLTRP